MKKYLSWEKFEEIMNSLKEKIKNSTEEFDGVHGIPRNGLIPAIWLSHKLNLPLLEKPTKNTLIVDDISDGGSTLAKYKNYKIATLFSTNWTKTPPNFFIEYKLSQEEWIVFPWEDPNEEEKKDDL